MQCECGGHYEPFCNRCEARRWISVVDKIPEFNKKVLAYDTQRIYIAYRALENEYNEHWVIGEQEDCIPYWAITSAVTHWMPLPKVPDGVD